MHDASPGGFSLPGFFISTQAIWNKPSGAQHFHSRGESLHRQKSEGSYQPAERQYWSVYIYAELESLLQLASVFYDEAMQALGLQCSVAVKASVASKDLPLHRLFSGDGHSVKAAV
jgi:hypothetical protein